MKIQKSLIFVLPYGKQRNFPYLKIRKILRKQEVLEEIGNFLPFNIENLLFSMPFKTRSPRIKKILAPFKSEKFEGFEGNRKFLK
ncbi:MAG: hypothetical protein WC584_03200 [Candidatus Pacearchaeota archaeon]